MPNWCCLVATTIFLSACAQTDQASTPSPAPVGGSNPPAVEALFYAAYRNIAHDGIPGDADRAQLQPFITKDLNRLLIAAHSADAMRPISARFKGDPFTAKRAGATSIDLGKSCSWGGSAGATGVCSPLLSNSSAAWDDQVFVVQEGPWLVDDIAYGGTDSGDNEGRLEDLLKRVISSSPN
jgi:hypothetical protein